MTALHAANFLQNHSLFAVQAITVLVVTGQDASTSNLIPTLLSTGISISQDMVRRLCSFPSTFTDLSFGTGNAPNDL
jgi:hypothetical protein